MVVVARWEAEGGDVCAGCGRVGAGDGVIEPTARRDPVASAIDIPGAIGGLSEAGGEEHGCDEKAGCADALRAYFHSLRELGAGMFVEGLC